MGGVAPYVLLEVGKAADAPWVSGLADVPAPFDCRSNPIRLPRGLSGSARPWKCLGDCARPTSRPCAHRSIVRFVLSDGACGPGRPCARHRAWPFNLPAHSQHAHCRVCPPANSDASFRMVAGHRRCRKSHGVHIASCSKFVRGSAPPFVAVGPFSPSPWRAAGG